MRRYLFVLIGATILTFTGLAEGAPRVYFGLGGGYGSGGYGGYGGYMPYGYGSGFGYGSNPYRYGGYGYAPGIGVWSSPNGYGGTQWSTPTPNYYAPSTSYYYAPGTPATPVPSAPRPTSSAPMGLKVTQVMDGGPAKAANLRSGDIITWVGPNRTQTFEELQQALAAGKGSVELTVISGQNQKTEKVQVKPDNGKIGVTVEPVFMP